MVFPSMQSYPLSLTSERLVAVSTRWGECQLESAWMWVRQTTQICLVSELHRSGIFIGVSVCEPLPQWLLHLLTKCLL